MGAGESGVGAAMLAQKQGYRYLLSDSGSVSATYRKHIADYGLHYEENGHSAEQILQSETIVKSPGIPGTIPLLQEAQKRGVPVISEVEFAYQHCKEATIVAVTGTNGKTTVAHLLYDVMKKGGLDVTLAGNVGQSFAAAVANRPTSYYALEISSFQLDDIQDFKPHIAIITNITPDHLDRYGQSMERYVEAKFKIVKNQDSHDYFLYCADDEQLGNRVPQTPMASQKLGYSLYQHLPEGAYTQMIDNNIQIIIKTKKEEAMSIKDLALQGKHNTHNSMAAGVAAKLLGIRKEAIRESLAGFDSLEHRLESVIEIYGMKFINDSKATNVNSTWYALDSIEGPIIWLAGGVDKGNDYSSLYGLAKDKVKAIICVGEDNDKLHKAFGDKVNFMMDSSNMDEAVRMAYKLGNKGDTILLSPACASFDLFENFEDRGRQFKQSVREL